MKLLNFLNEMTTKKEDYKNFYKVLDKVDDILVEMAVEDNTLLYRGSSKAINIWEVIKPRKDRMPKDTPIKFHNLLNEALYKKFGWRPRTEGIFATFDYAATDNYGKHKYIFFPIGNYRYIWSSEVSDAFVYAGLEAEQINIRNKSLPKFYTNTENISALSDENTEKLVKKMVGTYIDKNLDKCKEQEITFKCDSYLLVDLDFWSAWKFEYISNKLK